MDGYVRGVLGSRGKGGCGVVFCWVNSTSACSVYGGRCFTNGCCPLVRYGVTCACIWVYMTTGFVFDIIQRWLGGVSSMSCPICLWRVIYKGAKIMRTCCLGKNKNFPMVCCCHERGSCIYLREEAAC